MLYAYKYAVQDFSWYEVQGIDLLGYLGAKLTYDRITMYKLPTTE